MSRFQVVAIRWKREIRTKAELGPRIAPNKNQVREIHSVGTAALLATEVLTVRAASTGYVREG
jgi:hypothetical protein